MPELTPEHKAALEAGRSESRKVRAYLEAIEEPKRKGRRRTVSSITARLAAIDAELGSASTMKRLQLIQEQADLSEELGQINERKIDIDTLENEFVNVAASYSERKGITYSTWRKMGVPASVLSTAGIARA